MEFLLKGEEQVPVNEMSPIAMAFLGDAVLELYVRNILVNSCRKPVSALHKLASNVVSAKGQSAAVERLLPLFSSEETGIYKRGRNANKHSSAKNASGAEYSASTGLETLLGYLYIQGHTQRLHQLLEVISKDLL